jgi:glycine cleavage system aminomethyltransferase T
VLDLCGPYARGVLLQTVLNKSVIFPAFQHAKAKGVDPLAYDVALSDWLGEQGYEAEIDRIMAQK